jgi:hypothetical protein
LLFRLLVRKYGKNFKKLLHITGKKRRSFEQACRVGGGGHKKSSSGESEELSTILVNDCRAVNLTYLSRLRRDGIGTLYRLVKRNRLSRLQRAITLCLS